MFISYQLSVSPLNYHSVGSDESEKGGRRKNQRKHRFERFPWSEAGFRRRIRRLENIAEKKRRYRSECEPYLIFFVPLREGVQ
jgi:hypothetical protein